MYSCSAAANPPASHYSWYLDDGEMRGQFGTQLELYNVTRNLHNMRLTCEAKNVLGKASGFKTIQVQCRNIRFTSFLMRLTSYDSVYRRSPLRDDSRDYGRRRHGRGDAVLRRRQQPARHLLLDEGHRQRGTGKSDRRLGKFAPALHHVSPMPSLRAGAARASVDK